MKVKLISLRKYKMCLGWKYRLKHLFSINKYWSGKIIQFMVLCEYGIEFDFRKGDIVDHLLTNKEKKSFWMRIDLLRRKN